MADEMSRPDPRDIMAVRSRVSWQAIFAGAMVAVTFYMVLMLLGVALLGEAVARDAEQVRIGAGAAIFTAATLLISFFFGGWATSRLAVGESKLEAILYGLILWGLLFIGMLFLQATGMRTGFSGMVGEATGSHARGGATPAVASAGGAEDYSNRVSLWMEQSGMSADQIGQFRSAFADDPTNRAAAAPAAASGNVSREAAWWALLGVVVSLTSVIFGALVGSGELPVPVPVIGVKRNAMTTRRQA